MVVDYLSQVSLTVSAIGPEPLTYKWKKDGVDIIDKDCTGVNEQTLIISSFSLQHEGKYTCEVKSNQKSVESNPAKLELSMYNIASPNLLHMTLCKYFLP